jgi:hypothetical protein
MISQFITNICTTQEMSVKDTLFLNVTQNESLGTLLHGKWNICNEMSALELTPQEMKVVW